MNKFKKHLTTIYKSIKLIWHASSKGFIGMLVFSTISGIFTPISIYVYSIVINELTKALANDVVSKVVIAFLFYYSIQIFYDISFLMLSYIKDIHTTYINMKLTNIILKKVESLKMISFDNSNIYNDLSMINSELYKLTNIISNITNLFTTIITLIGILGIILFQYRIITIIALISFIPVFLIELKINNKILDVFISRLEKTRLSSILRGLMLKYDNIKEIKVNRVGKHIRELIIGIYEKYISDDKIIKKKHTVMRILVNLFVSIIEILVKIYLLITGVMNHLLIGTIIMNLNLIDYLMSNISSFITNLSTIIDDNHYISSVFSFLENNFDQEHKDGIEFNGNFETIRFENVYFKYHSNINCTLKNINVEFKRHKSYLIVGTNGAGKTTLIKLLASLYEPTSGRILIDEQDICKYNIDSYRRHLGVVFQDFIKYPLSVSDNIKLGNCDDYSNDEKMKLAAIKTGANEFIENMPNKYNTILQREFLNGTDLSHGQWQKLAISRAYFSNSSIILMDEPAAPLDAYAEKLLYSEIAEIMKQRTTIMISHRYTTAKMVDEIIVLDNNTVIEHGSFKELMNSGGAFSEMFKMQACIYGLDNHK